jgi:hypothetical protein
MHLGCAGICETHVHITSNQRSHQTFRTVHRATPVEFSLSGRSTILWRIRQRLRRDKSDAQMPARSSSNNKRCFMVTLAAQMTGSRGRVLRNTAIYGLSEVDFARCFCELP